VDWFHVTQARIQCHAVMNTVRTFGLHKRRGISYPSELFTNDCSMEVVIFAGEPLMWTVKQRKRQPAWLWTAK